MSHYPDSWIMIAFATFKGLVVALVVLAMGTTFLQSVAVAFVSGGLGMMGMVGAAWISSRATKENRKLLRDIKQKVGADQREMDRE